MKIYTSYFANYRILKRYTPISIARFCPEWALIYELRELAPQFELVQAYKAGEIDKQGYEKRYREETLSKLDPQETLKKIGDNSWGRNVALICYEKPSDFCHRHIVAKWFRENGIECEEL